MTYIEYPTTLAAAPLDEASIVAGNPVATSTTLYTSPDGNTTVGLFRCTPGTFRYSLEAEEITHLIAGHVVIQPDGASPIEARAGDTFILPAGQSMLIDIREAISDIYVTWTPK